ncbi:adenylate/guanylate cyclase domain-containing protein [Ruegeria sp. HKCCD7255]|uniref:adenylate/guanylate cyclase domain-containing protein n=1 Tax=Ruegeria sp. HKCCD7255 TaxID=2683004 RepID=UPI001488FFF4|nr:adenylate/guanylate cyclase domain-containing protein [Ruegeria sp. HKCCD7255]
MPRRLIAILAADVVGYSSLMARDEQGTLDKLLTLRKTVFDPQIAAHSGRLVKLMGDGALVEFPSVTDAVACAIAVQTQIDAEADPELRLRIGINLGDVIIEGGDIYGQGVNVAARLEAKAQPGGICISDMVRQGIGQRLRAMFSDGGEHSLKNIEDPVRIYQWSPDDAPVPQNVTETQPISDNPGIAVLAFDNMSADPEQEYFSDGIAEDIITALSHFREFFVIARNTSFTYKGQAIRVDDVCRDLGVRYLLEGSVRKAGQRVRVTAQLIDGSTGAHIWAERYDRAIDDIFAVQDEITQAIVQAVAPETLGAETRRARAKRPDSLSSWDKVLQARWHLGKFAKADNDAARALLSNAVEADPNLCDGHAGIALCDLMAMLHVWRPDTRNAILSAKDAASIATGLDDNNAHAHAMLGMASMFAREFDEAETHLSRAVTLNPNLATGFGNFAAYYGIAGRFDEAKAAYEKSTILSPRDPLRAFWRGGFGIAAYVTDRFDICLENARAGLKESPGYASLMRQEAASLAMLGKSDEAQASVDRLLHTMPSLTIAMVRKMVPVRYDDDWEKWLEGLRRAGLPE